MGTKFAPVYATLTIGYLEEKMYREIKKTFGINFGNYFGNNWKLFLGDCYVQNTSNN